MQNWGGMQNRGSWARFKEKDHFPRDEDGAGEEGGCSRGYRQTQRRKRGRQGKRRERAKAGVGSQRGDGSEGNGAGSPEGNGAQGLRGTGARALRGMGPRGVRGEGQRVTPRAGLPPMEGSSLR